VLRRKILNFCEECQHFNEATCFALAMRGINFGNFNSPKPVDKGCDYFEKKREIIIEHYCGLCDNYRENYCWADGKSVFKFDDSICDTNCFFPIKLDGLI
jgi:hypothetical protein